MIASNKRGEGGIAENTIVRLIIWGVSIAILLTLLVIFANQSDASLSFFSRLLRLW